MAGLANEQEPNGSTMQTPPLANGTSSSAAPASHTSASASASTSTTTNTKPNNPHQPSTLSADEIALYDRQIRLWGAQAQERIRSAHILLVSLRALGTEIAKTLVLAGISSLTIIDDGLVSEEDLGAQYFLREEDVGKPRAESAIPRLHTLNPHVLIRTSPTTPSIPALLTRDQTFYTPFSCIIACDADILTLSMINTAARVAQRPFYAGGIHGFYGFIFADLVAHEFVVERERSNVPTQIGPETLTRAVLDVTSKQSSSSSSGGGGGGRGGGAGENKAVELVKKQEIYCPLILANSSPLAPEILSSRRKLRSVPPLLPCLRALFDFQRTTSHLPSPSSRQDLETFTSLATTKSRELLLPPETLRADFLRSFIQNLGAEIVPTAAFVGGRLAEDVINVLGKREQPIQNWAFFDGEGLEGRVYCLFSMPPELAMGSMMGAGGGVDMGMVGQDGLGGLNGLNGLNGLGQMGRMDGMAMQTGMDMGDGMGFMGPSSGGGMAMDGGLGAAGDGMAMEFDGNAGSAAALGEMDMQLPVQSVSGVNTTLESAAPEVEVEEGTAAPSAAVAAGDTVDSAAVASGDTLNSATLETSAAPAHSLEEGTTGLAEQ